MTDIVTQKLKAYEEIERAWLRSLAIPLERIPDEVVVASYIAHATKRYPENARWLIDNLVSNELINQALGGTDEKEDEY